VRVVGVDWSGRATGEHHHLWTAELAAGGRTGPLAGRSREDAACYLLDLADRDPDLIVGLDFSFSLPAWFLSDQGIAGVDDLWSDRARLERWLEVCDPPFWGKPGRRCPPDAADRGWRAAERAAAAIGLRLKSTFQIGGAGTVGTGSLRGMPMLARLRAAGFSIWPFDPPRPPLILEVWPRHHYGGPLVKSSSTARAAAAQTRLPAQWRATAAAGDDAFDAAVTATDLATRVDEILTTPPMTHPLAPIEGWIWGVPVPNSDTPPH